LIIVLAVAAVLAKQGIPTLKVKEEMEKITPQLLVL
jgi:hypothetical protein